MDWKQFIASLASSLAWPAVAAVFLFLFRSELARVVQRLAHLKYKDLEMDFENVKREAQELHEEVAREAPALKSPAYASLEDQILDAVERAPSTAILLAWSALETAIASAVARLAISPEAPSYRSPMHNIDMLSKYGGLSKRHQDLLLELRTLRNKVAHDPDSMLSITKEQALSYATAAFDLIQYLERLSRKS